jgi:hypothetical protein
LVDAGDVGTWPPHEIAEGQSLRPADEAIDRQRPIVRRDPRYAEMAKHDRVFDTGHAVDQLVLL